MNLNKVMLVSDGPGVMVHTAPLILALQAAECDVTLCVSDSAGLFATPYAPAMLSGHPLQPWPLTDAVLQACRVVLLAPCSAAWLRQLAGGTELKRLREAGKIVLVAPAALPQEETSDFNDEINELCGGVASVVPSMGHEECLGALGSLRVASAEQCVAAVKSSLCRQGLAGRRVLVTAGPTAEDADPVRYITNRSTGRMGAALAEAAAQRGAEVTLVHGPMSWPVPVNPRIHAVPVRSAQQMHDAVMEHIVSQDAAILCAAVADYTPVTYSDLKIKKGHEATFALLLKRTPDILAAVGRLEKRPFLVGFAAESDHVEENAQGKLRGKNCDMLCANDVTEAGSGFAVATNRVTIFERSGAVTRLPQMGKGEVAARIVDMMGDRLRARETSQDESPIPKDGC